MYKVKRVGFTVEKQRFISIFENGKEIEPLSGIYVAPGEEFNQVKTLVKRANALQIAAEQAYRNEILDTEMRDLVIGRGMDWGSKEEWIEDRIQSWLKEAKS
jgi:hypothetical protein